MGWSSIYTGRLTSQDKKQRIDKVRTWGNEEVVKSCPRLLLLLCQSLTLAQILTFDALSPTR